MLVSGLKVNFWYPKCMNISDKCKKMDRLISIGLSIAIAPALLLAYGKWIDSSATIAVSEFALFKIGLPIAAAMIIGGIVYRSVNLFVDREPLPPEGPEGPHRELLTSVLALALVGIGIASTLPGNWQWLYLGREGFIVTKSPIGYFIHFGHLLISITMLITAVGLWRRSVWSRQIAQGVCITFAVVAIEFAVRAAGPLLVFSLIAWSDNSKDKWLLLSNAASIPFVLVISLFVFRYLSSDAVHHEFETTGDNNTSTRDNNFWRALSSVVLILAFFGKGTVFFDAKTLPPSILTSEMLAFVEKSRADEDTKMGRVAHFSIDDRYVALYPAENETAFLLLDVATGKLTRKPSSTYFGFDRLTDKLSPDFRYFLRSGNQIILLVDDSLRFLSSWPSGGSIEALGFTDSSHLLLLDKTKHAPRRIILLNIDRDQLVYAKDIASEPLTWGMVWSPNRKRIAWHVPAKSDLMDDRGHEIYVLNIDTGIADYFVSPCGIGHLGQFSDDGRYLSVSCYARGSLPSRSILLNVGDKTFMEIENLPDGYFKEIWGSNNRMIFKSGAGNEEQISAQSLNRYDQTLWHLPVGKDYYNISPTGRYLIKQVRTADGWTEVTAGAISETDASSPPSFQKINLQLPKGRNFTFSPSGNLAILTASPQAEVIWTDTLFQKQPKSLLMNLRSGTATVREAIK